ncbi:MAG: NAD-dependent epimerase/dehydratase family protein [Pseudomonadota bacterium]
MGLVEMHPDLSMLDDTTTICVSGVAGFIGFHLAKKLLEANKRVIGLDNFSDYYDVALKRKRAEILSTHTQFTLIEMDITDSALHDVFAQYHPRYVINLAAQAGVRYSLRNPAAYIHTNISGFTNILEACRHAKVAHLVYASSSSVYGANLNYPFSEKKGADHPISLYAATKKSNEMLAHSYSHIFQIPTTGLRFFTVYGPWGRPDMALFLFTRSIYADEAVRVFNHGNMRRDFTYIDDIVDGIIRLIPQIPTSDPVWHGTAPDPASSNAPYRIYNIGRGEPEPLMRMIEVLETAIGKTAKKDFQDLQDGDVPETCADISAIREATGFNPQTAIDEGIPKFLAWYKTYHNIT